MFCLRSAAGLTGRRRVLRTYAEAVGEGAVEVAEEEIGKGDGVEG